MIVISAEAILIKWHNITIQISPPFKNFLNSLFFSVWVISFW